MSLQKAITTKEGNERQKSCKTFRKQTSKKMAIENPSISSDFQLKWTVFPNPKTDRQNEFKSRIQLYDVYSRSKVTHRLKMRGWKKILYANSNQKRAGDTILISDKNRLKVKNSYKKQRKTL